MKKSNIFIITAMTILLCLAIVFVFICISLKSSTNTPEPNIIEETPVECVSSEPVTKGIIVLDPGHGKSSGAMTTEEKLNDGWVQISGKGWGEWRHWKSHTTWQDCEGSGCTGRAPSNGGCWYPIGYGDRNIEPDINLNNALSAKKLLEEMGYTVRMTRNSNDENPSMTKRLTYCYPNQDTTQEPDADIFVCLHSNAGGGRGSYYIALSGLYDQAGINEDYIQQGNLIGKCINDRIVAETSLSAAAGGVYNGYPELVLFCKSPIPIGYMEIGFFDDPTDLNILQTEYEKIGQAIAKGIDDYFNR